MIGSTFRLPQGMVGQKGCRPGVRPPPLPAPPPGRRRRQGSPRPRGDEPATEAGPDTRPLLVQERQPENRIEVPDDLPLTDPLDLKTQRALNKRKRVAGGLIPAPAGGVHTHTWRPQHDRALRIIQALLIAFEKRGFPVSTRTDGVRVTILDESLGFGLEQ